MCRFIPTRIYGIMGRFIPTRVIPIPIPIAANGGITHIMRNQNKNKPKGVKLWLQP